MVFLWMHPLALTQTSRHNDTKGTLSSPLAEREVVVVVVVVVVVATVGDDEHDWQRKRESFYRMKRQ